MPSETGEQSGLCDTAGKKLTSGFVAKPPTLKNSRSENFFNLVRQFPRCPTHPPPGTFFIPRRFKPDQQFWDQISQHAVTDTVPMYISRDPLPYLVPIKAFRTAHPNPPPHLQPDPVDMFAITNFLPQLENLGI
ncbi:hypothetical protein P5V15_008340 [Pogonomyrmex californicus]